MAEKNYKTYKNESFSEERALYGARGIIVDGCTFAGPEDGESALKETGDIIVSNSLFELRYPLWHSRNGELDNIKMTETCRAALWYDSNLHIRNSVFGGIKALRECEGCLIEDSVVDSKEFGWQCDNIIIKNTELSSEYPFLHTKNLRLENVKMKGKYSFQYTENAEISDSVLDTKDAFWHSKNVTVKNSSINGEYLGWYSEGLTLINCKITGTQPLCYCKSLTLIDCEMFGCDLAFEYSDVNARILTGVDSVKNPKSGRILAKDYGEIIIGNNVYPAEALIEKL